jgi:16S rRNA processing protein RimM
MGLSHDICLGVITGAVGVRGEVRIKPFTANPRDVASYGPVATKEGATYKLSQVKASKAGISAKLSGIETRDEAAALKGTELFVDRSKLPEPQEDEFYHVDLIGLQVEAVSGEVIGTVKAVHDFGSGDLLEVMVEEDGKSSQATVFVPFTKDVAVEVQLKQGKILVDPPQGLLGGSDDKEG